MSKNNIMNTYGRFDVVFERGEGTKIFDREGNEYIDFVSGVAVNCLGHSNEKIVNTIKEQSEKLIHISNYYWNENAMKLSEKLCDNSDHQKVFFCNSGTEAIETSLKLSRKYGSLQNKDKNHIIFMNNSFHGRTMGALSVTGQPKYQEAFRPLIGNVEGVDFNNIEQLKNAVNEKTCAIILEPIQGEGGILCADLEFLKVARELCDQYNALLIFDEVQCGIGRSGKLFTYQKYGVVPDVVCLAKALGGGFPIGAILAKEKAAQAFVPGDHGNTYGGNPLGTAIGYAILEELIDGKIIDSVEVKGEYIRAKLKTLKEKYKFIDEIRGMGLLVGIKLNIDNKLVSNKCFEKKLLAITAGDNVLRLLPPLNVKKEDIDLAIDVIEEVFKEME